MISMRSTLSDGSTYQVFEDNTLIGLIRVKKVLTCDKYVASLYREGQKDVSGKEFDSPQNALDWIGKTYRQAC